MPGEGMWLDSYFLFLQEQIKDIIIIKRVRPMSLGIVALTSVFVPNTQADPVLRHMGDCSLNIQQSLICADASVYVVWHTRGRGVRSGILEDPERGQQHDPVPFLDCPMGIEFGGNGPSSSTRGWSLSTIY